MSNERVMRLGLTISAKQSQLTIDYYNNRRYQHRLFIQTPMQAHVSAMNRAA